MAFVPANNCVQVEVRWLLDSQKCENRFFVDMQGAPDPADMTALGVVVKAWIASNYIQICPDTVHFTELVLTDWTTQLGTQQTVAAVYDGTGDADSLPNETSFCVSLRTGLRGRSARGRWYTPPPTVADRLGINGVTANYRNAAVGALQTLMNNIATAGFYMSVVSFVQNKVPVTIGQPLRYTTALAVDDTLDSQRRRKPGNGS